MARIVRDGQVYRLVEAAESQLTQKDIDELNRAPEFVAHVTAAFNAFDEKVKEALKSFNSLKGAEKFDAWQVLMYLPGTLERAATELKTLQEKAKFVADGMVKQLNDAKAGMGGDQSKTTVDQQKEDLSKLPIYVAYVAKMKKGAPVQTLALYVARYGGQYRTQSLKEKIEQEWKKDVAKGNVEVTVFKPGYLNQILPEQYRAAAMEALKNSDFAKLKV